MTPLEHMPYFELPDSVVMTEPEPLDPNCPVIALGLHALRLRAEQELRDDIADYDQEDDTTDA